MLCGSGLCVRLGSSGRGRRLCGRLFSSSAARPADFTHVVIGGGVVGLAVARALAERAATAATAATPLSTPGDAGSVLLLERHNAVGTETSARNSEVIHAGLYYGAGSLKTRLCIRGRDLLYAFCARYGVPHRRTGKWIVAQTPAQRAALDRLHTFAAAWHGDPGDLPLRWVGAAEARRREPAVRAEAGVLESLATGIVDSHGLMQALLALLEQAGGVVALQSPVVAVKALPVAAAAAAAAASSSSSAPGSAGWELHVKPPGSDPTKPPTVITADTIVNAAGLGAAEVHNMIVGNDSRDSEDGRETPPRRRLRLYYAKGNYFSYGASQPRVSTLVYPVPEPGLAGLGTHLTLDLGGRMRFGPDVEWVDDPTDLTVHAADRLPQAVEAIRAYLPGINAAALQPDYAGIRPKLQPPPGTGGAGSKAAATADFIVRQEPGYAGWINLLGIESPGLTSSLAIGEMVEGLLYDSQAQTTTDR